jgi:hypothetical protein
LREKKLATFLREKIGGKQIWRRFCGKKICGKQIWRRFRESEFYVARRKLSERLFPCNEFRVTFSHLDGLAKT